MAPSIFNILEIIKRRLSESEDFHLVGQGWTLADICAFMFLSEIDPTFLEGYASLKDFCEDVSVALFM